MRQPCGCCRTYGHLTPDALGLALTHRSGCLHRCSLEPAALPAFLHEAVSCHRDNAFHNSWHVTDVLHAVSVLLATAPGALTTRLPPEDVLSLLLAALCHDLDHPGLSNGYCRASNHVLAAQHGTISVLEKHHASVAATLLHSPAGIALLAPCPAAVRDRVLDLVPRLILATDIELNASYCAAFADAVAAEDPSCGWVDDLAKREAFLSMVLKVADISNVAKPWPLALRWAELLKVEHLLLAERERQAGLPPTAFLSAPMAGMCKGFILGLAGPMIRSLGAALPWVTKVAVPLMEANVEHWSSEAAGVCPPERPTITGTPLECVAALHQVSVA